MRAAAGGDVDATLVFVRHGESRWIAEGRFQGRGDPELSELGRRQAALVARRLRDPQARPVLPIPGGPPDAVWHSPLARAAQTAASIAGQQPAEVDVRLLDAFTEIAQGAWEGMLSSDVAVQYGPLLDAWRREPTLANAPGGERLLDAAARVRDGLAQVLPTSAPTPLSDAGERPSPVLGYATPRPAAGVHGPWSVVVAHDGIFRLALMTLLGIPLERFWSFPFALCAITVVEVRDGHARLRAHNLTDHLEPLEDDEIAAAEAAGERRGAL